MVMYEWISNRELATIIWCSVLLMFSLAWLKTRQFVLTIFKELVCPPLVTVIIYTAAACLAGLIIFEPSDGWEARHLWITLLWFFSVGIGLSFKSIVLDEARWLPLIKLYAEIFTASAIFDFLINFRSLPFIFEFILVPIIFISFYISYVKIKGTRLEHASLLGNAVLFGVVLIWVFVSIKSLIIEPEKFFSISNMRSFYIPFLFSICISPVVFLVFVISIYQRVLGSIKFSIKTNELSLYACHQAIIHIRLNIKALERWRRIIHTERPATKYEVQEAIVKALS